MTKLSSDFKAGRGCPSRFGNCVIGHWTLLFLFAVSASLSAMAATNETTATNRPSLAGLFDDPVIARAKGGVQVKLSELETAVTAYRARLAEQRQAMPEAQRPLIERQLVEDLLVGKILKQRAKAEDIEKATARTQQIIAQYMTNYGSEEGLRRELKLRETTLEKFTLDFLEQEMSRAVMDRELRSKITVSEAQVQDFYTNGVDAMVKIMQEQYDRLSKTPNTTLGQLAATTNRIDQMKRANLAKLQFPERVHVVHILISTLDRQTEEEVSDQQKKAKLALAQSILAKARAGENFTNLVQQYSEDRNLSQTHGEYVFSRDEPYAIPFKSASFSLTNSQISDIVTTVFGYHIIKRLELLPPKKLEYEKAAPEIRKALAEQEFEQRIPEFFAQVKKEGEGEVLDPKYRFPSTLRDETKPAAKN